MKILITGGTGQIGAALAAALRDRGDSVRCLVRDRDRLGVLDPSGVELVPGDVTRPDSLGGAVVGVDAVVHAAGVVSYWPANRDWQHAVNVVGTRNMLDAARAAGVRRFVLTSSIAALGFVEGGGEGDEESAFNWGPLRIGYMDSKHAAERLVLGCADLETIAVNPGIVFGRGDARLNGGRMLMQVYSGRLPGVPPGSTTAAVLDDVVNGHIAALERGRVGHRYVLGGTAVSFRELFRRVGEVVGRPAPTRVLAPWLMRAVAGVHQLGGRVRGVEPKITPALVQISTRNRRYSSQKAARDLGYHPAPIEAGIADCWDWYQQQGMVPGGPG